MKFLIVNVDADQIWAESLPEPLTCLGCSSRRVPYNAAMRPAEDEYILVVISAAIPPQPPAIIGRLLTTITLIPVLIPGSSGQVPGFAARRSPIYLNTFHNDINASRFANFIRTLAIRRRTQ